MASQLEYASTIGWVIFPSLSTTCPHEQSLSEWSKSSLFCDLNIYFSFLALAGCWVRLVNPQDLLHFELNCSRNYKYFRVGWMSSLMLFSAFLSASGFLHHYALHSCRGKLLHFDFIVLRVLLKVFPFVFFHLFSIGCWSCVRAFASWEWMN